MIKKALFQPISEAKSTKSAELERHNSIQIVHLKRVDELIVLQHVIRRFKMRHEADFNKISELRNELSNNLRGVFRKNSGAVSSNELYARTLWCCMRLLDSPINLQMLDQFGVRGILPTLRGDLKLLFSKYHFMKVDFLDVRALAKILVKFGDDISDINRRLNYTRYFSLLGLTSYVSGRKFYNHYIYAKVGHHQIKPQTDDPMIDREALWMISSESENDDDFSVLLKTSCAAPLQTSKNIQIFGGQQHTISINNIPLKNRLILSVPTNEAPERIDNALREFRAALMQEFANNGVGYFTTNNALEEHRNSIFMRQFAYESCLIEKWNQVQGHIAGLWSWDISDQEDESIPEANWKVVLEFEEIQKNLPCVYPFYKDVKAPREWTNAVIGPRPPQSLLEPTIIDRFVTRSMDILGSSLNEAHQ